MQPIIEQKSKEMHMHLISVIPLKLWVGKLFVEILNILTAINQLYSDKKIQESVFQKAWQTYC